MSNFYKDESIALTLPSSSPPKETFHNIVSICVQFTIHASLNDVQTSLDQLHPRLWYS